MLDSKGVKILDKERDWRRRGINKLYMEKGGGPDPEQKRGGGGGGRGLRFSLFHTLDRALASVPRRLSGDSELPCDKRH